MTSLRIGEVFAGIPIAFGLFFALAKIRGILLARFDRKVYGIIRMPASPESSAPSVWTLEEIAAKTGRPLRSVAISIWRLEERGKIMRRRDGWVDCERALARPSHDRSSRGKSARALNIGLEEENGF